MNNRSKQGITLILVLVTAFVLFSLANMVLSMNYVLRQQNRHFLHEVLERAARLNSVHHSNP